MTPTWRCRTRGTEACLLLEVLRGRALVLLERVGQAFAGVALYFVLKLSYPRVGLVELALGAYVLFCTLLLKNRLLLGGLDDPGGIRVRSRGIVQVGVWP